MEDGAHPRLRGWLLLLSRLLIVGHPLMFAVAASQWIAALPVRGAPLGALLVVQLVVVAAGIAAGVAITRRHPGSARLAIAALALSGALDLFIYGTSIAPNNRMPGDTPLYVAATLAYHCSWIVYLARSRQVRQLALL